MQPDDIGSLVKGKSYLEFWDGQAAFRTPQYRPTLDEAIAGVGRETRSAGGRAEHRIGAPDLAGEMGERLAKGGLVSNSPPANVKTEQQNDKIDLSVLGSGIDTLVLAFDVQWLIPEFLERFRESKRLAKESKTEYPFRWSSLKAADDGLSSLAEDDSAGANFSMQQFGVGGYEWVLVGHEFSFRIGDWLLPGSRPSMMVEFRSETLWHLGARKAFDRVVDLIMAMGGTVERCRVSRLDLCVDLRMTSSMWASAILRDCVCRAPRRETHHNVRDVTGYSIGVGDVHCRIYDKLREIRSKSHKFWFADVWQINLEDVSDDERVIRVEYQLRREALKDLGIDEIGDLWVKSAAVWGYCSQEWLRFVDHAESHHTAQEVRAWWAAVQTGYKGAQVGVCAVRTHACHTDEKQLLQQIVGLASAVAALRDQGDVLYQRGPLFWFQESYRLAVDHGIGDMVRFIGKENEKRARYYRTCEPLPVVNNTAPDTSYPGCFEDDGMPEEEWLAVMADLEPSCSRSDLIAD